MSSPVASFGYLFKIITLISLVWMICGLLGIQLLYSGNIDTLKFLSDTETMISNIGTDNSVDFYFFIANFIILSLLSLFVSIIFFMKSNKTGNIIAGTMFIFLSISLILVCFPIADPEFKFLHTVGAYLLYILTIFIIWDLSYSMLHSNVIGIFISSMQFLTVILLLLSAIYFDELCRIFQNVLLIVFVLNLVIIAMMNDGDRSVDLEQRDYIKYRLRHIPEFDFSEERIIY